jgi:hypothetical protein
MYRRQAFVHKSAQQSVELLKKQGKDAEAEKLIREAAEQKPTAKPQS